MSAATDDDNFNGDTITIVVKDQALLICTADCLYEYNYSLYGLVKKKYVARFMGQDYNIDCSTTDLKYQSLSGNVKIFPNPVKDRIWFESDYAFPELLELSISNALGQIVLFKQKIEDSIEIDVKCLAPGIYYLTLSQEGGGQKVYKVVKE